MEKLQEDALNAGEACKLWKKLSDYSVGCNTETELLKKVEEDLVGIYMSK